MICSFSVILILVQPKGKCVPYTEDACRAAATEMGFDFVDSSDYNTKGCYAYFRTHYDYGGKVYFGTGGSENDKKKTLSGYKFRPSGHDCTSNNNL